MKLKDICEGITDGSHNPPIGSEKSCYLMLSSKNIFDDQITIDDPRYLTEEQFFSENKRTNIKAGDVLMTIVGTVGRTAVVNAEIGNITLQRSVAVLHPRHDVCISRYLMYILQSKKEVFERESHGVAQKGLYLKQLSDIDITLPELEVQRKIINNLDRVNLILRKRNRELSLLDNLIKARFVEMFGDYRTNNREFETHCGSELFKFSSGKFLPESKRFYDGVPVYGGNGIAFFTDEPLIDYPTVIIGRVGAWCGNVRTVIEPVWITDNAIFIKEFKTNKFTLEFITELMQVMDFHQYADFSGQPKITQKPLENLSYLTPPLEMQNEFTDFVKQIDKSKFSVMKGNASFM